MFTGNGVNFDNDAKGWHLSARTRRFPAVTRRVVSVVVPGLPGVVVPAAPVEDAAAWPFEFYTSVKRVHELDALFSQWPFMVSPTADPSKEVSCTVLSRPDVDTLVTANDPDDPVTFPVLLQMDVPWFRDVADQTAEVALPSSVTLDVLPGLSAPVGDALVRVTGPVSTVQISNPDTGATVVYGAALTSSQALVYNMADQSARLVAVGAWSGWSDVSGVLDLQGPRLTVTPVFTDPADRKGQLKADATGTGGGSLIAVKGRGAYRVA